jgi:hypothetical protein
MIGYTAIIPYNLSNEYLILTLLFIRAVIETGYSLSSLLAILIN